MMTDLKKAPLFPTAFANFGRASPLSPSCGSLPDNLNHGLSRLLFYWLFATAAHSSPACRPCRCRFTTALLPSSPSPEMTEGRTLAGRTATRGRCSTPPACWFKVNKRKRNQTPARKVWMNFVHNYLQMDFFQRGEKCLFPAAKCLKCIFRFCFIIDS